MSNSSIAFEGKAIVRQMLVGPNPSSPDEDAIHSMRMIRAMLMADGLEPAQRLARDAEGAIDYLERRLRGDALTN